MTTRPIQYQDYIPLGAAAEMFADQHPEILMDGPAGTGKTRALLEKIVYAGSKFRNARLLLWRKTRASMSETVLPILEQHVFHPGHPALADGVTRGGRKSYRLPSGSEIIVAGMDNPTRIMSGQFDMAALFEGTEVTLNDYEYVQTRLRNGQIRPENMVFDEDRQDAASWWPRDGAGNYIAQHQSLVDCNPDAENHWLNRRPEKRVESPDDPLYGQPLMRRLLSRHADNPSVTPQYLAKLERLTGLRKERLFHGRWCSAEGQVWPEYDAAIHTVYPAKVPGLAWFFGSMDFGFRAPGCFQVWGVTGDRALYRVAEWYAREHTPDWWADRVVEAYKVYPMSAIVCDSAEPDRIVMLNKRLAHEFGGRAMPGIAREAVKARQTGLDCVRDALAARRVFLVLDALRGADDSLLADELPTCTEDELPGYVFLKTKDGRPIKEMPDPTCADHGCDCLRYACMFAWGKDYSERPKQGGYRPGTLGAMLGHDILRNP